MSALIGPEDRGTWSSRLSMLDRERLRKVVRKVHLAHYPAHMLTDRECDRLIDAWGPKVGEDIIRRAVSRGLE